MVANPSRQLAPEPPSRAAEVIDLRSKLYSEVRTEFWRVLAYEQDNMEKEAEVARQACLRAVQQLRRTLDAHSAAGPEEADAAIAWAIHYARNDFAKDLQRRTDWRVRRGN